MTQQMTKSQAHAEVLRRWRERPFKDRKTYAQAQAFAGEIAGQVDFATLGQKQKIIEGWLVGEVDGFTALTPKPRSIA
jgi:hypothetical protein